MSPDPRIEIRAEGLELVHPQSGVVVTKFAWSDVSRICTYKIDLITTDCICLRFEFASGTPAVQISEEWPGFAEIFGALERRFPSIPGNWYSEVMLPVYERKETVLFNRHAGAI